MRVGGINWWAVITAAIIVYAIGAVIYVMMIPMESYVAMSGITEAEKATATARMMFSPIMPIMTAVFMAILFKWGQVAGAATGIKWGVAVALASAVPTMMYEWVYGGVDTGLTMIDCAHLLLGHVAAGAILGGWK